MWILPFVGFVFLFQPNGHRCARLITSKSFDNGQNSFTWNFILPAVREFSGLGKYEESIIHNPPQTSGPDEPSAVILNNSNSVDDEIRMPLDIDIRFDDTPEETVASKSAIRNCSENKVAGLYWREWTGTIPSDAIVAGLGVNNCGIKTEMYFGQAYLDKKGAGLQPGQLFNSSTSLTVSFGGIYQLQNPVKVLCGNPQNIAWLPVGEASSLDPSGDLVPAGFENGATLLFGRAKRSGRTVIGKIVWRTKTMYYPFDGKEMSEKYFQVLCYKKSLVLKNFKIPEI